MTNTDVTLSFVLGIDPGPTGGTASLRVQALSDGTALLSYGVPIARRDMNGNVFVDCFSKWSTTTSRHQSHALDLARQHANSAHRVNFDDMPDSLKARRPGREHRKPIGSTL
jgi:hypothetical protein